LSNNEIAPQNGLMKKISRSGCAKGTIRPHISYVVSAMRMRRFGMKRLLMVVVAALLAAPAFAQDKPASSKRLTAAGKVSAVAADSVTVKGKDAEWTFGVEKATSVVAKGGSHKMAAMKADKKPTVITEFVSVGDDVTVKYHDMGATKHAATVTVKSAAPAPKK
jgi:hypothetical protein